ncbi:surfeit locus protein 6-domain-containing protein [Kockovaella imperatae]|uniref:Surfeit locus protein 6-domain-containing protein n=1 Tax=Kockovaella imperatae TaxID=4999 RepID=A0A1Y1UT72_9TREE|nr:surfeit locus protein 6-domain-containing protein [Kockovaella imperatae]ORX41211.1 surfeit locus protein 6-domain-containing protein [Kockovaella imperatae]
MASAMMSNGHAPDLLASLERHNESFTKLLSLIPSRFYAAPESQEVDSKWMKKKKRQTGEEIKEQKKKARQDKFDPSKQSTAADLVNSSSQAGPSSIPLPISSPALPAPVRPLPPTASISDLRARLHSKIEGFRRDRGVDDDADPQSRSALEAETRRRRGEMRDRRRRERKEERRKAREKEAVTGKSAKPRLVVPHPRDNDGVTYPTVKLPSAAQHKSNFKPIANPSHALAHLEKHKRKLDSMTDEKRREVLERERWAKAEERAAGGKVADQETVLKKAVKRKEKEKSKSGKEWSERKRDLERAQAASIKKRSDNIAARADAKRNKKLGLKDKNKGGKMKKKGRPGFEGGRNKNKQKDKA